MEITKTGAVMLRGSVSDLVMEMFLECLSRGMTLPFTVCHMGVGGSVSVTRLSDLYSPMVELFKTSEWIEPPINVMIVDWLGHSLRVTVTQQDEELQISACDPDHLY